MDSVSLRLNKSQFFVVSEQIKKISVKKLLEYVFYFTEATLKISSSSCRAISTDFPDLLPPPISIVHRFQLVFKATSCIGTELLYVGSSRSSCLCSSLRRGPQEYVSYEFVPTSLAVSCMSGSSNLDNFRDGWLVAVQLLLCGVLPPGLDNIACSILV